MTPFKVQSVGQKSFRLGLIGRWGTKSTSLATPTCTIYTRYGHIPHITNDVIKQMLGIKDGDVILQLPMAHL